MFVNCQVESVGESDVQAASVADIQFRFLPSNCRIRTFPEPELHVASKSEFETAVGIATNRVISASAILQSSKSS